MSNINFILPAKIKVAQSGNFIYKIKTKSNQLEFCGVESNIYETNLRMIDSNLPEILGKSLIYCFTERITNVLEILKYLNEFNPLNYDLSKGHLFYENKIADLLIDSFLGMSPNAVWNGRYHKDEIQIFVFKIIGELHYFNMHSNQLKLIILKNTKIQLFSKYLKNNLIRMTFHTKF